MRQTELARRLASSTPPARPAHTPADVSPLKYAVQRAERIGLLVILILLACALAGFLAIVLHDLLTSTLDKLIAF